MSTNFDVHLPSGAEKKAVVTERRVIKKPPEVFNKSSFRKEIEAGSHPLEKVLSDLEDDHSDLEVGAATEASLLAQRMETVLEMIAERKANNYKATGLDAAIKKEEKELAILKSRLGENSDLNLREKNKVFLLEKTLGFLRLLKGLEDREVEGKKLLGSARSRAEENALPELKEEDWEELTVEKKQNPELTALYARFSELKKTEKSLWFFQSDKKKELKAQMLKIRADIAALQSGKKPVEKSKNTSSQMESKSSESVETGDFYDQRWDLKDTREIVAKMNKLQSESSKWYNFFRKKDLEQKVRYLAMIKNNREIDRQYSGRKTYFVKG